MVAIVEWVEVVIVGRGSRKSFTKEQRLELGLDSKRGFRNLDRSKSDIIKGLGLHSHYGLH